MPLKHSKDFGKTIKDFQAFKQRLPNLVGGTAVRYFKESFRRQGWAGDSFTNWKPRKPSAKRDKGRALLIDSGRLRRGIRISASSFGFVQVSNDVPYAAVHNDGFKGTVNVPAHTRRSPARGKGKAKKKSSGTHKVRAYKMNMNIPQRKFMGNSKGLNKSIDSKSIDRAVTRELKRIL
jgi:phage gpG-like protein